MTPVTRTVRRCINGLDPDALFSVPGEAAFADTPWVEATGPRNIAALLIDRDVFLSPLKGEPLLWLWRDASSSRESWGVKKVSKRGLERHLLDQSEYGEATFVVWFDAQALREGAVTNWQMERMVFRALRRMDLDDGAPKLREYEFAGFADEIERYGPADAGVEGVIKAAQGWSQGEMPHLVDAA